MEQQTLKEGKICYTFPEGWDATKFDDWSFYRKQFQNALCGNKAVDFLAFEPDSKTLWLIELKDYRQFPRVKGVDVWDEVAIKVRDTLACLYAARVESAHDHYAFANKVANAKKLRVVLHFEQPRSGSRLFNGTRESVNIQQKLKKLVKPVDAHPKVIELSSMGSVPWSAK